MKIEPKAIGDIAQATPQASGDMAWFDKIRDIIDGVNKLLSQYQQLKQGTPLNPNRQAFTDKFNPSQTQIGSNKTMENLLDFAIKFCENLETQGFSEQPIGKVISEIPMPVKQITSLLKAIKTKQSWGKKNID